MIRIGEYNKLTTMEHSDFGFYLTDGKRKVLLPNKYVPAGLNVGDELEVFVYTDSEDRPVATTLRPRAIVGEFAWLTVKAVSRFGAFLDWGLEKDLFAPFKLQLARMQPGESYCVRVLLDDATERPVAASKLKPFLRRAPASGFKLNQVAEALVAGVGDLGFEAIVNGKYAGMLYRNEVFTTIKPGDRVKAYVKKVRADGKLDLALSPQGYLASVPGAAEQALEQLRRAGGFMAVNDKTPPSEIELRFQMSKKTFKKALGSLYKARLVKLDERGITLL